MTACTRREDEYCFNSCSYALCCTSYIIHITWSLFSLALCARNWNSLPSREIMRILSARGKKNFSSDDLIGSRPIGRETAVRERFERGKITGDPGWAKFNHGRDLESLSKYIFKSYIYISFLVCVYSERAFCTLCKWPCVVDRALASACQHRSRRWGRGIETNNPSRRAWITKRNSTC